MSNFLCSELECMTVPTLSCSVFWSRTPSWISFLLIINFSPARQVNYEVWGFRITDGDVCSDWGECNGCFCLDGSGNNGPFIDDLYSAKTVPVERHLCPDCGKSYVQKRNQVRDRKQHHKLDDGLRFSCSQCDKKKKEKKKVKTISDELHSHMFGVLLKHFKCETCKMFLHTREALSQGGIHAQ